MRSARAGGGRRAPRAAAAPPHTLGIPEPQLRAQDTSPPATQAPAALEQSAAIEFAVNAAELNPVCAATLISMVAFILSKHVGGKRQIHPLPRSCPGHAATQVSQLAGMVKCSSRCFKHRRLLRR